MSVRNILMVVSLALSVLIGLVVARGGAGGSGGGGGLASGGQGNELVIGLSLATLQEPRWQADRDIFTARCKALGATVKVQDANNDDIAQAKDCQSLITEQVKVLVIVPHDGVAMAKAVEAAHAAGIPVISYDRLIKNCDLDLYLTFDNVRVGRLQAQFLVDHLPTPGKGRIVRIYGAPTDNNAKLFKQGQDEVLKPYLDRGDIQVVFEDWAANWDPAEATRIMAAAITKLGHNFEGVLASNDGTAGGAIQAMSGGEGLAGKVVVTGQDADIAACQRIVSGTQSMTVYKPIKRLATRAAEVAVAMARGRPIVARDTVDNGKIAVPSVLEEIIAVTKENMVETVIKDGFQKYDEVYRSVPEGERPVVTK